MNEISSIQLKSFNSFGLPCLADKMIIIEDENDILTCYKNGLFKGKFLILSGGSNVLLCSEFNGIIFHPVIKGINIVEGKENNVIVTVKAGVIWDDFVAWTVVNGFGGLENLSLIPGYCGTAPVQNIGAFGTEIGQHIVCVEGVNLLNGKIERIDATSCKFGYRDSIFKKELKDKFFITSTTYKLNIGQHKFKLEYGNLTEKLENKQCDLSEIRQAVIDIRRSKLPDPQTTGNAGSFFKNPAISFSKAKEITEKYPDAPLYSFSEDQKKIAAGWMIEKCGWKGKVHGNAGVHAKQALVIVNHGNATAEEISELAGMIEKSVLEKFGIILEREVNIIS